MFRSLLVPLDGSPFGEHALPIARQIALQAHATLHLVHVHVPIVFVSIGDVSLGGVPITDIRMDNEYRERERVYLEAVRTRLTSDADLTVDCEIVDGPVSGAITQYAARIGADLVVMTTHGRGGLTRFWLGSTADAFIRHSPIPTLLVRPHEALPDLDQSYDLRRILIPLDGSALAEQILDLALTLGGLSNAAYDLLQVIETVRVGGWAPGVNLATVEREVAESRYEQAQQYLADVVERLQARDVTAQPHVICAEQTASAILDYAQRHNADAIALATHGWGGLKRVVLGSVSDKVLRGTVCPVLLYRPREP
ncbi:MAG TPA: universal stress protein [Herpetosiphonaceae bacterium]